ncbi:MAG: alpha-amylase family glycosyl hydrolase [Planctomycetota bacterium]
MRSLITAILCGFVVCAVESNAALQNTTCAQADAATPLNERPARPSPEWVTGGVMYQIQPRAFTPEGTLKAATARLPKVAEMGVDIVYLCPVFVSDDDPNRESWSPRQRKSGMNNPRNPYRMKDYYHVDAEYGTDDDLKEFITEAHKFGMRVLLDMVYLHCGPNAVFLEEHPNFVKRDKDGKIVTAAWGFPAINHANPELREYLWKNMEYWVKEFGADGFRCDVSDGVPLDFWETARDRLEKSRPDICMLAEGRRREDQLKAFDLDYGWGFQWDNAAKFRAHWEKMRGERPRGGARFIRFIDNHDIANDDYNNRIEKAWGSRRVHGALVTLFTLDGVPMIYNGQEVADTARHSIFGRSPIDWANGDTPTGKASQAFCKKLCTMRHAERALTHGAVVWLDNDQPDAVLSFLRRASGEEILSVLNLSDRSTKVRITFPETTQWSYNTLIADGAKAETDGSGPLLNLEGFGYLVAKRK